MGTTEGVEESQVQLNNLTALELSIVPDINDGPARASPNMAFPRWSPYSSGETWA